MSQVLESGFQSQLDFHSTFMKAYEEAGGDIQLAIEKLNKIIKPVEESARFLSFNATLMYFVYQLFPHLIEGFHSRYKLRLEVSAGDYLLESWEVATTEDGIAQGFNQIDLNTSNYKLTGVFLGFISVVGHINSLYKTYSDINIQFKIEELPEP